ncbi:MAG: hypothetical protein WBK46_01310, partial [Ruminococcus flavefaciens]
MTKEKGTDILHPLDIYVYAQKRGHEKMIHFWQHDKTVRRLPIKIFSCIQKRIIFSSRHLSFLIFYIIAQAVWIVKQYHIMVTQINFVDNKYYFVGAAFGSPYNNTECQEGRRR